MQGRVVLEREAMMPIRRGKDGRWRYREVVPYRTGRRCGSAAVRRGSAIPRRRRWRRFASTQCACGTPQSHRRRRRRCRCSRSSRRSSSRTTRWRTTSRGDRVEEVGAGESPGACVQGQAPGRDQAAADRSVQGGEAAVGSALEARGRRVGAQVDDGEQPPHDSSGACWRSRSSGSSSTRSRTSGG